MLLTWLGDSVVTVMFVLAVISRFLCVTNKVRGYRYCEKANAPHSLVDLLCEKSSKMEHSLTGRLIIVL